VDYSGLGYSISAFYWRFRNESPGLTEGEAFLNYLRDCQLIKKTVLRGAGSCINSFLENAQRQADTQTRMGLSCFTLEILQYAFLMATDLWICFWLNTPESAVICFVECVYFVSIPYLYWRAKVTLILVINAR
jgi:hypothetical protein